MLPILARSLSYKAELTIAPNKRESGETGTLKHCRWDCKWGSWLGEHRTVSRKVTIDPAILLLSISPREMKTCGSSIPQSRLTLCDPMDYNPPGSSVHGILQARILEWVAISSSWRSSWPRDRVCVSCIGRRLLSHWATWEVCPWTDALKSNKHP